MNKTLAIKLSNEGFVWRISMHCENMNVEDVVSLWERHNPDQGAWRGQKTDSFYGTNITVYDRKEANKKILAFENEAKKLAKIFSFKAWQQLK